mmetsp:Transcript_27029/g.79074  ORF Transcript_27029/g.79074 Transcript_27029/m.79074 type:complete len:200 (-) Transcript_27029:199-798(-)
MHWHGRDAMHQPNATAAGASPPASRCGWPALVSPPLSASPSPAIRLWDRPAPVPVVSSEEAAAAAAAAQRSVDALEAHARRRPSSSFVPQGLLPAGHGADAAAPYASPAGDMGRYGEICAVRIARGASTSEAAAAAAAAAAQRSFDAWARGRALPIEAGGALSAAACSRARRCSSPSPRCGWGGSRDGGGGGEGGGSAG